MAKRSEYYLTEREIKLLRDISEQTSPLFEAATMAFLTECLKAGLTEKVASASLALYSLMNLSKILAISSGMPSDLIDSKVIHDIGYEAQSFLGKAVSEYIEASNARMAEGN